MIRDRKRTSFSFRKDMTFTWPKSELNLQGHFNLGLILPVFNLEKINSLFKCRLTNNIFPQIYIYVQIENQIPNSFKTNV